LFLLFLLTETFPETLGAGPSPFLTPEGSPVDFTWLFLKVVLAMVLVCGAAFAVIKYLLPRAHYIRSAKGSNIEILERMALEPKKNLYILRVAKKMVLIGTTETSLNRIVEWDEKEFSREPAKE
jgi:flagellar biogenesis protein FliO